jgi:hypothetical protein
MYYSCGMLHAIYELAAAALVGYICRDSGTAHVLCHVLFTCSNMIGDCKAKNCTQMHTALMYTVMHELCSTLICCTV